MISESEGSLRVSECGALWGCLVPEALDSLAGGERNKVYRMLRLEVRPSPEGYEVAGVFALENLRAAEGRG
jgi:hypothetical protein